MATLLVGGGDVGTGRARVVLPAASPSPLSSKFATVSSVASATPAGQSSNGVLVAANPARTRNVFFVAHRDERSCSPPATSS